MKILSARCIIWIMALFLTHTTIYCDSEIWSNRQSLNGAIGAYEFYKKNYQTKRDYESAWKFARSVFYYAGNFELSESLKESLYLEGKSAGEFALQMNPEGAEALFYYSVCLSAWAEANGAVEALKAIPKVLDITTKLIAVNPYYEKGAPYLLRARIYHKAPAIISVGDDKKAEEDYRKGIAINPSSRTGLRFYAEFLIERGRYTEAKKLIERFNAIPSDENDIIGEANEKAIVKQLMNRLPK